MVPLSMISVELIHRSMAQSLAVAAGREVR